MADKSGSKTAYTSARIWSAGRVSFKYGKIEAKIKVPNDRGLWPAFWMLGADEPKGWPYCGELDILETWNEYNFAQGTIHWENEIDKPGKDSYKAGSMKLADKSKWHIYGMNWNSKEISFYVDDKVYKTIDITPSHMSELRNNYFYFIINCAVGGNLPGIGPVEDFKSARMEVDYVRVYQRASDNGGFKFEANDADTVPTYKAEYFNDGKKVSESSHKEGEYYKVPKAVKAKHVFLKWTRNGDGHSVDNNTRIYQDSIMNAEFEKINLKKATIKKAKSIYKKTVTVKFKASGKYDGFQVKVGKKTRKTDSNAITIPKLKSKKKYKIKVRTYRVDSTGKCYYGKWSKSKKVKIK